MGRLMCDDGNVAANDGCAANCASVELGYHCASQHF